ncbi:MAG TPA: NAD(P)H-dependent oxidoreductase subunit E [Spirochaetia bacterium]|nr:NAD(P)H-dependent oxidoreductase subunit E [Spirochaetia bacterium]
MQNELIEQIVNRYEGDSGMLIPMMQDLQAEYGYLPAEQLRALSQTLQLPLTRLYGVATFYTTFRLAPKGEHEVTLCMGTVCFLKGASKISETICREFGIEPGGTTADRLFTLQAVNCVGACALAPVMIVDGNYHDGVTPDKALKIINRLSTASTSAQGGGS